VVDENHRDVIEVHRNINRDCAVKVARCNGEGMPSAEQESVES